VQGPKHVVFSLNKRLLQILELCFDLPYLLPHLHIKHNGDVATKKKVRIILETMRQVHAILYSGDKEISIRNFIFWRHVDMYI
jgi:hypothetical protein